MRERLNWLLKAIVLGSSPLGLASTVLNGTSMHGVKPIKVGDNEFTYEVVDIDGGKTRVWEERYARFPIPLGEIEQNEAVQQFDEWK